MSHYMTALAMKVRGLKPAAKIVLYWLADHHNGETGACYPSLNRLSDVCEMSKASIARHLSDLEEAGFITRNERSRGNGSQTTTSYVFHINRLSQNETGAVSNCDRGLSQNETPRTLEDITLESNHTPLIPQGGGDGLFSETEEPQKTEPADDLFDQWWNLFPKRSGTNPKKSARASFKRAVKVIGFEVLCDATRRFAESRQGEDPKFTPMASTWLNQERWEEWLLGGVGAGDAFGPHSGTLQRMNPDNPMEGIPEHVAQCIRYEIDPEERDRQARLYWAKREAAE